MDHQRSLSRKYESLDYDLIENVIYLEHLHRSRFKNFVAQEIQRWLVISLIGFVTALSGFFVGSSVTFLTGLKFSHIINLLDNDSDCAPNKSHNGTLSQFQLVRCMAAPFSLWLSWNVAFVLLGSLLVTYVAPIAAGSGIPVVKSYLNGVKIPQVVRFKTYLAKLLGVLATVTGGLAAGKEGPFVHCGAAIGAGFSQGKSTTLRFDLNIFKPFRNDRDKRDFVSAGAAAGVAAAFGAPIGGVLFALEEGASFWNQSLTWRIFFCSMMTYFLMNLLIATFKHQSGMLAFYSLVNFGLVEELDYFWFELIIFAGIGVLGGLVGASFCRAHVTITHYRDRYVAKKWLKVLETVVVTAITTTAGALLILFVSECAPIPKSLSHASPSYNITIPINYVDTIHEAWHQSLSNFNSARPAYSYDNDEQLRKALDGHILKFVCPPGQYSVMSSLWLKTSEGVSSTFMILEQGIWSMKTLAIFLVVYYFLALLTYGLSISSGVFIPSLLIGAAGGRLIGLILNHFFGPADWLEQQNKFAIIGAVSVLGGIVRMTISLTAIVIEATGCISFGLPIMICLTISKWVADFFIEGLYDIAIKMANIPFIEWEPPRNSYTIYASDIMEPKVVVLQTTESVANIVHVLKTTTHNGFPVVEYDVSPNERYRPFTHEQSTSSSLYQTPEQRDMSWSDKEALVTDKNQISEDSLVGSFQRCSIINRQTHGRLRGIVLRWQLVKMLEMKIFNEVEGSYTNLNLASFRGSYPRYPELDDILSSITDEMYGYHADLRSIMQPTPYTVHYASSYRRIFQIFRSLGLRHLVVIDDRNQVVGMITRKDIVRYVQERDENGMLRFYELKYSS